MSAAEERVIRLFAPGDAEYRSLAEVQATAYPEYPFSADELRHEDSTWEGTKYFLRRWVAEADGALVGWAQVNHARSSYVADTYLLDVGVRPDARRRGHGSALYATALEALSGRAARRVRAGAKESMPDGVAFLVARGFEESKRDWGARGTFAGRTRSSTRTSSRSTATGSTSR